MTILTFRLGVVHDIKQGRSRLTVVWGVSFCNIMDGVLLVRIILINYYEIRHLGGHLIRMESYLRIRNIRLRNKCAMAQHKCKIKCICFDTYLH